MMFTASDVWSADFMLREHYHEIAKEKLFHPETAANRELLPVATSYHWTSTETQKIMYIGRDLTMASSLTPCSRQGLLAEGSSGQWKSWHSSCWRHGRHFLNSSWSYFGPQFPFMFLIHYPSDWARWDILMRSKEVGGIAADGEGKHVLHLAMLQPLLCRTWAAFPRQGDSTEPPKQQWHETTKIGNNWHSGISLPKG